MEYTYRQLFTKHLPEPYRSQAIANAIEQDRDIDDPSETAEVDPEDLHDVVSCAFTWKYSPEGRDYWLRASGGKFEASLQLEVGKRYLTRDGRTAEVVHRDICYSDDSHYAFDGAVDGETGFSWSATGRYESQRENPLDLVEEIVEAAPVEAQPATHRLLEVGETIQQGDEVGDGSGGWREVIFFPTRCNVPGVFRRALIAEPQAVDPGTGYRLLEEGETILEGDEEADEEEGGGWSAISPRSAGDTFDRDNWYPVRRKIAAPPTYRLLNPGEIIREDDEVYLCHGWEAMGDDCAVGANHDPQFQRPIRRKIKSHEDA